ncbi:hypothetical protein ACROYT_G031375 [Oculina patagonica]
MIRNQPNIKPSDWNAVEREFSAVMDKKRASNMKQKLRKDIEPFGHNFEAKISFKEYADKKDPLYVYKKNDKSGNPDMPSFVLKTSKTKMTMALHMDKTGDHFLSKEFCFFFTVKGNGAKGANIARILKVFWDDADIKLCEFHFKDLPLLDSKGSDEFKQLCDRLLLCTTTTGFQAAKSDMDLFIEADDSRAFLTNWVSWWHEHRGFIFRAFTNPTAPQMNQGEVIHAGFTVIA